jgi:uncharacterized protein
MFIRLRENETMRRVTTVGRLEGIVGKAPRIVLMKETHSLDEGCRSILANAPIAGIGFQDQDGLPHTTLIGGAPGFARVESPTRLSFELPEDRPVPVKGGAVSFVFLVPGIGETLRLNGSVVGHSGARVAIELCEAFVHCARCILRSGLWRDVRTDPAQPSAESAISRVGDAPGPLVDAAVAGFLASSHFAFISSWDADGASDTTPKGDPPGFMRILDGHTLALPDRRGNKRADTAHNLLTCDRISLAALAPGRVELLHVRGTAHLTDDPALLSTMALRDKAPHLAFIVDVEHAEITANEALRTSNVWDRSVHADPGGPPDMNRVATEHIAANEARGATATMARTLSRGIAASPPKLVRRVMDRAYRKQLEDEGY